MATNEAKTGHIRNSTHATIIKLEVHHSTQTHARTTYVIVKAAEGPDNFLGAAHEDPNLRSNRLVDQFQRENALGTAGRRHS